MIDRLLSYADALTAAISRMQRIEIDGLRFERRADKVTPTDYVSTGRHTLVFELAGGSGKQYRVMIEPVPETHRAQKTAVVLPFRPRRRLPEA